MPSFRSKLLDFDSEDLQSVVDRFAKASWIKEALISDGPIGIVWSAKGIDRMAEITRVLRQFMPEHFDPSAKSAGIFVRLWCMWKIERLKKELKPPRFSLWEDNAFLKTAIYVARPEGGPSEPPVVRGPPAPGD